MKALRVLMVPAALAGALAQGPAAKGEEPLRLELRVARRPAVVPVPPDPAVGQRDAEAALAELESLQREERILRQSVPFPPRRPDLSYDVWSGIQARALADALRRR